MIKSIQSLVKSKIFYNKQQLILKSDNFNTNRILRYNSITNNQQYNYSNFLFKWKVRYNLIYLVEDERKMYFFEKIVNKFGQYGEKDIQKVKSGSDIILGTMKDPVFICKVKTLLLQELEEDKNQDFFKILSIRTSLLNDLILIKDKKKAESQLIKMKNMYYQLKNEDIQQEDLENFIHQYIISNIQIENYQEALIFTEKLNSNLEKLKKETESDKSKEKELINKSVTISSYLWTIFRQGEQNYQKSMEVVHNLSKLVSNQNLKLFQLLKPQVLNQFDQMMIDVIHYNIEKKEFERSLKYYKFYVKNYYRDMIQKQLQHQNIINTLESIQSYYNYIDLSSQKFNKQKKIDKIDEDIYSHSVEQYYKYSIYLNEEMGVDINCFQIKESIDQVLKKLSGANQRRISASLINFEEAIQKQKMSDLEDHMKEIEEQNKLQQNKENKFNDQNQEQQQLQKNTEQEGKENVIINSKLKL
ncbi:hypothetical protein TTHERM_00051940 (macronuclear) [Tetrahymena thermophila SB210]|uniref:Uncharacterized protein n=1 Tax=Tetrahymena thermophila (strain SB210) TaxID=312017 RepID=Q23CZ5_TETTS|nr:hypothetical protein TTHERM_00051940 [Tetrahymena thermophila SB210]EAR94694.2 hypothetical protein TTHERM_00051940 [Tetrahymena thermophila SB210]|eukprot:XP_001014891.2 hypothetical protein TTHERM_00051940 [Tetrahymena thermophila SB210]